MDEEKIFLINSYLLQYPDEDWYDALEEAAEETDKIKHEIFTQPVLDFLKYAKNQNILDLAELYVNTFDFAKNTNLYLTYYRFSEQRERGKELVKLKQIYSNAGFEMREGELPDCLPVILEFAYAARNKDILLDYISAIEDIFNRLSGDNNPYSNVLKSVLQAVKCDNNEKKEIQQPCSTMDCISLGG